MFSPIIVLRLCSRLLARQPACLQTHYPCCQNQAAPDNKTALVVSAVLLICLAVRTRLELATPCVTGMYSNQTELPDQSCFFWCFISQKRVQKYAHFLNWQNIFSNMCCITAINICYIGVTVCKIFFCLPRRVHDFFYQKGGDSVTLGLTVGTKNIHRSLQIGDSHVATCRHVDIFVHHWCIFLRVSSAAACE